MRASRSASLSSSPDHTPVQINTNSAGRTSDRVLAASVPSTPTHAQKSLPPLLPSPRVSPESEGTPNLELPVGAGTLPLNNNPVDQSYSTEASNSYQGRRYLVKFYSPEVASASLPDGVSSSEASNPNQENLHVTDVRSPEQATNRFNTYVIQPPAINPNSNGGNGGTPNLLTFFVLGIIFLLKACFGGGSAPPSLPGFSLGSPTPPPLMGIFGDWSSYITSLITALLASIGNWVTMITKNKIIVGNPDLAVLTTAAARVYLFRKKRALAIIGFLLYLLVGYLFWKLKLSMPTGMVKLLQGDSTGIMLSSETIILAIAFTVTGTAACIVALVIWIKN